MKNKKVGFSGEGKVVIFENEIADPGDNQIQIEMRCSQISPGTELVGLSGKRKNPDPKAATVFPGYSIAGIAVKCGKNTPFKTGDRVMAMGGGQAEHALYCNVSQNLCMKMPDTISFEQGSYVALALTSLQAVRRLDFRLGEMHIVAGLGLVGQLCAQFLTAGGAKAIGLDVSPLRTRLAEENGIFLTVADLGEETKKRIHTASYGDGVDGGILCFGGDGTQTLKDIYKLMVTPPDTHTIGAIVVVGGCIINIQLAAALGNIDIRSSARTGPGYKDDIWEKGAAYPRGWVRWDTQRNMQYFGYLLEKKLMNLDNLTTHRYDLEKAPEVYEKLLAGAEKEMLGVLFTANPK